MQLQSFTSTIQNINKCNIKKSSKKYYIEDEKGEILSEIHYYRNNADWTNASTIHLKNKCRYKNTDFITLLMSELYKDITSKHISRGLYCIINSDKTEIISSIKKIDFKEIYSFKTNKSNYRVFIKGSGDINKIPLQGVKNMTEYREEHGKPNEELMFQLKRK